jgi:hypothetical protein
MSPERNRPGEEQAARPAQPRRFEAPLTDEAAADGEVGARVDRFEERLHRRRGVLTVAVHSQRTPVARPPRVGEARRFTGSDAEVDWVREDDGPSGARDGFRAIARPIVHDEDVDALDRATQLAHGLADASLLVVREENDERVTAGGHGRGTLSEE